MHRFNHGHPPPTSCGSELARDGGITYIPGLKRTQSMTRKLAPTRRSSCRSDDGIEIQRIGFTDRIPMGTADQITIVIQGRCHRQLLCHSVLRVCLPAGQVVCQLLGLFHQASVNVFFADRRGAQRSQARAGVVQLVDLTDERNVDGAFATPIRRAPSCQVALFIAQLLGNPCQRMIDPFIFAFCRQCASLDLRFLPAAQSGPASGNVAGDHEVITGLDELGQ